MSMTVIGPTGMRGTVVISLIGVSGTIPLNLRKGIPNHLYGCDSECPLGFLVRVMDLAKMMERPRDDQNRF